MSRGTQLQPKLHAPGLSPRQWDLLAIACLLLATLPWWLALKCPLTLIDDPEYVANNADVLSGLNWHSFVVAFTSTRVAFWLPMTWLSLMLDATVFGRGPLGFHLTNIVLHIANAILLYLFLRKATGQPGRSLLVAALFAIHPLRVESVAWVTERKDVLSAFFGLLALLAYLRYVNGAARARAGWFLLVCAAFALSLMSKPMLVTLPCLLWLLDFWPLKRWARNSWKRLLLEKVPLIAMAVAMSIVTYRIQSQKGALISASADPASHRLANAAVSYARYLRDHFNFQDLSVFYPPEPAYSAGQVALSMALLTAISIIIAFTYFKSPRRGAAMAVGWLWLLGTLFPTIGLLQSGIQSRADRFTYFPSVGLFIAIAWMWPEEWFLESKRRLWAALAGGGCVAVFAVFTSLRLMLWRDPLQLYLDGLQHTRNNAFLEFMVAASLDGGDNPGPAIDYYTRAISHLPSYHQAHHNLAGALVKAGRLNEALEQARLAVQLDPHNPIYIESVHEIMKMVQSRATTGTLPS